MNEGADCSGYQFTAKADTIFDASHLPLKVVYGDRLYRGSQKAECDASCRHLGMEKNYKSVWYSAIASVRP